MGGGNALHVLHPLMKSVPLANGLPDRSTDIFVVCGGTTNATLYASNATPVVLYLVLADRRRQLPNENR